MDANAENLTSPVALRPPETVMRLERMGSFHQCRLSFMRTLLRRLRKEAWRYERREFQIDNAGKGHAVYSMHGPERSYSLVAFAHDLPADKRSDRVIAEAWDATFTLFDGIPDQADIKRLSENVPLQEAGRVSQSEISLSRANRSVRLWEHVVAALASGQQPDIGQLDAVGYLMRTTAVYGSGKFGAADRDTISERPEFAGPFQAEMLSVYLTRAFVRDLVEHAASVRSPSTAVSLDGHLARRIGIGNSTGLGMAPFLINHPMLLNNWIMSREKALARVRSVHIATPDELALFREMFARCIISVEQWQSAHPIQIEKLETLGADIKRLTAHLEQDVLEGARPWDRLYNWAESHLSVDGQEILVSLMLEPYSGMVDSLTDEMSCNDPALPYIDGAKSLRHIKSMVLDIYGWAIETDWSAPATTDRAWYVSAEKLEPRLGQRYEEPIGQYEQPWAPGRDAAALYRDLTGWPDDGTVAEFLLKHPEHRHSVRRLQIAERGPYAEIRDNTIGQDLLPIDMLRCKLSFFGAVHFDPRSDRWVRICMYNDAPYPEDLQNNDADFWIYPMPEGSN